MASKKQLKKSVKTITGELFADCVALSMCQQADAQTLDALMAEVISLHCETVSHISHVERGNERNYFRKLKADFTAKVNDISERIVKA